MEKSVQDFSQNKYLWIIGTLILLFVGWFGLKALISSFEDYRVTFVDAPKEVDAGSIATFTWRVDGPPTTINHTSIRLGMVSTAGSLGKEVKPQDTKYADFVKEFASGKYGIPLQFVGNIRMDTIGKYYFRVYALVKNKHYWSDEYTFEVKKADYKISLVSTPKQVGVDTLTAFTWRIDGPPTTVNHTVVYLGNISVPGKLGKEVKPQDTKYTDFVRDFASGKYDIPLQFVGNAKIATAGSYFFRAYAVINGRNYWTDEGTFEAK